MSRNRKRPPTRFDGVPKSARRVVTTIAALCGIGFLIGSIFLLVGAAFRIGFSPNNEVYRSGTVTVSGCGPMPGQLGMRSCAATVNNWAPGVRGGLQLTDAHDVVVYSRSPLSGEVPVVSRLHSFGSYDAYHHYYENNDYEVIVPADQKPLPNGVKVLLGAGSVLMAFVGTYLGGRIAWEIAARRYPAPKHPKGKGRQR